MPSSESSKSSNCGTLTPRLVPPLNPTETGAGRIDPTQVEQQGPLAFDRQLGAGDEVPFEGVTHVDRRAGEVLWGRLWGGQRWIGEQ